MAEIPINDQHHEEPELPTGEELAARLFSFLMAGVLAVIVLMAIAAGW